MKTHCCFDNPSVPIAVDTSVAINLNATGRASEIIAAFSQDFVMVDIVHGELRNGLLKGRDDSKQAMELVTNGHLTLVTLGDEGLVHFEDLVAGEGPDTLDDGEAATIAYALEARIGALIDERKAKKLCAERFQNVPVVSTTDLLLHPRLAEALGQDAIAQMVFNALKCARMNVPLHHLDGVVSLIGQQRAALCPSLPRTVRNAGGCGAETFQEDTF